LKPGRLCSNGRPVPLDRADYRKFVQGLADAGKETLKAAQSKNMDNMVLASGTLADACAACHDVYRDKAGVMDRCIP
jgi:cytochrome c556